MIHHRRVAGGGHPHQSTPTGASNGNSGFAGRSHATTGSDHGTVEVAAAALVDGLVGDSTPPGAGALHSGARREPPWGSKDHLRRKVAIVAAIGTESLESLEVCGTTCVTHACAMCGVVRLEQLSFPPFPRIASKPDNTDTIRTTICVALISSTRIGLQ